MPVPVKLELGSGHRGTRGYIHHDAYPFPGIDITCQPWELPYGDGELDEVLALAFIEHLTHYEALDTFREVHRILKPGGEFVFDVPDYPMWCRYYLQHMEPTLTPTQPLMSLDAVRRTLFGWQRWPGDEHKYGWDARLLADQLKEVGYCNPGPLVEAITTDGLRFLDRGLYRKRFTNPADAHLYVIATK